MIHDCNNSTCQLLNPSLEMLLRYEDLKKRVSRAEEIFFEDIKLLDKLTTIPFGLIGWCTTHHIFQLLNIEFIQELAREINKINPEIILEVGAGEGLLGKFLSKELNKNIILTDNYSWWEKNGNNINNKNVIKMDYDEAIEKYKPDFIIASWIPYKRWWTRDFRECESVRGYILIGEGPGGCTGSEMDWKTNWTSRSLDKVKKFGICRTDHAFYSRECLMNHTNVTYFERPKLINNQKLIE